MRANVLRVGLTGGVASGKSVLARMLAGHGAATCDADVLVEELYRPRAAGAVAVAALFGAHLLDPSGAVDRKALGSVVLGDTVARRRLEAAIHPLVRARIGAWLDALEAGDPAPQVALAEAALLVETGAYRDFHRVVVVSAPVAMRRQRALGVGWGIERFEQVVAAQSDDAAREAVADYVVHNDTDTDALARAAAALWRVLRDDAASLAAGNSLPIRERK